MGRNGKRNFKLVLEYDGGSYHGWQRQYGVLTIQEVLESRLEIMLRSFIRVRASGRTDAGVHARGQVVNFYAHTNMGASQIQRGLNSLLPADIVVLDAQEVPHSFHARFSAVSKVYEYRILNRPTPSALERRFSWHVRRPLAVGPMQESLRLLTGSHDFSAFMAAGSSVKSTQRTIYRAELRVHEPWHLVFLFEANGFLRHMVRNIVGTLVDAGKGAMSRATLGEILASKDRRRAGMTAPAHGLYLMSVHYQDGAAG
ncbi:tRNA pseudouridine(38-40) synthase TruA [Desulfoferrobacter suflitae]|uniref:tRNA pseudouridine(38-40) synthase TruA n=1 Tax=Desulfoferrobacter suflitae TaxID=2865782 RepID=UPI002164498D|nr:tRNA pseudouridine(38-40) synthase TruA [Desulfoferrobacter suflitae]MCK8602043.1 tRNA pseudouridine(38-40) synthase TruA [Desulfoferrobacter suflitae]